MLVLVLIVLFLLQFYRRPRVCHGWTDADVVAPTHGMLRSVHRGRDSTHLIFYLSPLDPHRQCVPCAGRVTSVVYDRTGQFHLAYDLGKSRLNEKKIHRFATAHGEIVVTQVAGLLTRRIESWLQPGQLVQTADALGIIHLGSRVDIWLPNAGLQLDVRVGDRVQGSCTRIARYV